MKHVVNFRLSDQAINALFLLEEKLHYSKTAIVEKALKFYAQQEIPKQKLILKYAGILGDKEAASMLVLINTSKKNKDLDDIEL